MCKKFAGMFRLASCEGSSAVPPPPEQLLPDKYRDQSDTHCEEKRDRRGRGDQDPCRAPTGDDRHDRRSPLVDAGHKPARSLLLEREPHRVGGDPAVVDERRDDHDPRRPAERGQ